MKAKTSLSVLLLLLIAPLLISCPAAGATDTATDIAQSPSPFIHHDTSSLRTWVADYEHAPPAERAASAHLRTVATEPAERSLLPLLDYVPAERAQGVSGTCWVFAGTGALELAHAAENGVRDRLSVQWFDSNYNGGSGPEWAGNGGTLTKFVGFYNERRLAVPWSNTNASYQDWRAEAYVYQRALVPAAAIAETPNYTLLSASEHRLVTRGVGQAQAIATIRGSIDALHPVFVGLSFPNQTAASAFEAFWWNGADDAVWDPTPYDGAVWDDGASHAVLCVGYDMTDPENPYWLMLNSMGTGLDDNRPTGTFRMRMDLDYDAAFVHDFAVYPAQWEVVDAAFAAPTPIVPFPGQTTPPQDLDHDGLYDDVNGNSRRDFGDIVLYFNQMTWIPANEPVAAFDYNGNGRIDFGDVVSLFDRL